MKTFQKENSQLSRTFARLFKLSRTFVDGKDRRISYENATRRAYLVALMIRKEIQRLKYKERNTKNEIQRMKYKE